MTNVPVIHVGMVKAASSTLQYFLFDQHPGFYHLGSPWRRDAIEEVYGDICTRDVVKVEPNSWRELMEAEQREAKAKGKVLSLSNEAFTMYDSATRLLIAERLKRVLGDARIILVIREQRGWFASRYTHQFLKPIPETRLKFSDWLYVHWNRAPHVYRGFVDYDAIAQAYERVFGFGNIKIVLMEELAVDGESVIGDLCDFIGVDRGLGTSLMRKKHHEPRGSRLGYLRRKAGILPNVSFKGLLPAPAYDLLTKGFGGRMEPVFPEGWEERISEHYREGNRALAERYGLLLEKFDYSL